MTSKKMEKLFHILDLNKDNKLSIDELKTIFQNSSDLQFNLFVLIYTYIFFNIGIFVMHVFFFQFFKY
jgi:hypothetical protein